MSAEKCPQCGAWWAWPTTHRCPPITSTNHANLIPQRGQVGFPDVQGRCPNCGSSSLFLGAGGYVTCSWIECTDPVAPTDLLAGDPL
jgi:ribosomal protein S27AE